MPINTEAIVWIACRFDQLVTPLMLWSLFAYVRFRTRGANKHLSVALFLFVAALFTKENAYILPALVLFLELAVMRPPRFRSALAFFGTAILCAIYRFWVFGGIGGYRESSGASSVLHFHTTSLKGLLLRAPAEMLFGLNWVQPPPRITLLVAVSIAVVLLVIVAFPMRTRSSALSWAVVWVFLAPAPAHSMIRVGADLGNSRELYFASVGAALVVALLLSNVPQQPLRLVLCALLAILFGFGSWHNLNAWRYNGAMSRRLQMDVRGLFPDPLPGSVFVFINLPRSERGIYFFSDRLGRGDPTGVREK